MFSVEINKILTENIPTKQWEKIREFPSSDEKFRIIFYNPYEFAMGAIEWQLKLLNNGIDVTNEYPPLLQNKKMCLDVYQPWSCDSKIVFLVNRKGGGELYNIFDKQTKNCGFDFFPISVLGSRLLLKYIIATPEEVFVFDLNGQVLEKIDFRAAYPEIRWLKSNSHFFVIGRESENTPPVIAFFDAHTNGRIQTMKLDPNEIVPYEYEKYRNIKRNTFALKQSDRSWTVGRFLDTWHSVDFDEEANILALKICRPTSDVYKKGLFSKDYECKIKDILVEIKIAEK